MIKRNEYKFPFTSWSEVEIREFINSQNMKQKYSMRLVNSIYFDSPSFDYHELGEEGIVPRDKVRLRWYGSRPFNINQSVLEVKSAFHSHREKRSINYCDIENKPEENFFLSIKNKIDNKILNATVIVRYKRFYYENNEGIRITLDYGIQYQKCTFIKEFIPVYLQVFTEKLNVLELKGDSIPASRIIMDSKLNWTRFSKYSRAMLNLY